MASLKVDLLSKKELIYELRVRGCDKEGTVDDLRKTCRELIRLGVKENVGNLGAFDLEAELCEIEVQLSVLGDLADEGLESKSVSKIVRIENKIEHYIRRINNVKLLDKKNKLTERITKLLNTMSEVQGKIKGSDISEQEKSKVVEALEDSFRELEEFNKLEISTSSCKETGAKGKFEPKTDESKYVKLRNPIEEYLRLFKPTDGMNVELLLNFLKVLISMCEETNLKSEEILELSVSYCKGSLRAKVLECISRGHDINRVHETLLANFVPITLKETLKREFVLRPQKPFEKLNDYVLEVKLYARLLKCDYSESEIVQLIVIGLNELTRSNLVLAPMPNSYADLEKLAVHCANVEYASRCRNVSHKPPSSVQRQVNQRGNRVEQRVIKCFNCGKMGHFARNCYSRPTEANKSNNFQKNE